METRTITEKQQHYIEALREKEMAGSLGSYSIPFPTAERALSYAFALNLPNPEDCAEASALIDTLKTGGATAYARNNPEFAKRVLGPIGERFGGKFAAINEAATERIASLPTEDKIEVQDSSAALRALVIDPLLSV